MLPLKLKYLFTLFGELLDRIVQWVALWQWEKTVPLCQEPVMLIERKIVVAETSDIRTITVFTKKKILPLFLCLSIPIQFDGHGPSRGYT